MSEERRSGWHDVIILGLIIAFIFWLFQSRRRVLAAFAILVVLMVLAERYERKEREALRAAAQQRAIYEGEREKSVPILWMQNALIVRKWEQYLDSIPEIKRSEAWRSFLGNGNLLMSNRDGMDLDKVVTAEHTRAFIATQLGPLFKTPLYKTWEENTLFDTAYEPTNALDVLSIKIDRYGIPHWNGQNYAKSVHDVINPGVDVASIPWATIESSSVSTLLPIAQTAYESHKARLKTETIRSFETQRLPGLVRTHYRQIVRADPSRNLEQLTQMVCAVLPKDLSYKRVLRAYPDYQPPVNLVSSEIAVLMQQQGKKRR